MAYLADEILVILAEKPRHGYDINARYEELFGPHRRPAMGQIYSTLKRLERDDLAFVSSVDSASGPARSTYSATSSGLSRQSAWLDNADPHISLNEIMHKFVLAVATASASGSARRRINAYIEALDAQSNKIDQDRPSVTMTRMLADDFDATLRRAAASWLEKYVSLGGA